MFLSAFYERQLEEFESALESLKYFAPLHKQDCRVTFGRGRPRDTISSVSFDKMAYSIEIFDYFGKDFRITLKLDKMPQFSTIISKNHLDVQIY